MKHNLQSTTRSLFCVLHSKIFWLFKPIISLNNVYWNLFFFTHENKTIVYSTRQSYINLPIISIHCVKKGLNGDVNRKIAHGPGCIKTINPKESYLAHSLAFFDFSSFKKDNTTLNTYTLGLSLNISLITFHI